MSIRAIAQELYRLQREVEKLEKELAAAPYREQDGIKDRLRKAKAEWQVMRNILNGEKTPSPFRQTPSTIDKIRNP